MSPKLLLSSIVALALSPLAAQADESDSNSTGSLAPISSTEIALPGDVLIVETNGGIGRYVVSKNEFYLKDKLTGETNIESLADGFVTAEEMAQFVRDEDGVWGQECKMVLYGEGLPQTAANRHLLTHKILVVLDKEVASMELLNQLASAVGVEVGSDKIGQSGSAWLRATCGGSAFKAAEILHQHESVVKARPIITNSVVKMIGNGPNDQYFNPSDQYYLHPNATPSINVQSVWCGDGLLQRYFGRNVSISILDDGVEGEHPELDSTYQYGRDTDFVDGDNDGRPVGDDDHGTAMAGIIGGRQNNGIGITGIAPAAELFSTRVFGVAADPQIFSDALEHERSIVDVIILGFVSGGNYVDLTELVEDSFFEMAERKDVPICYPAGSAGGTARIDYDRAASHRYTIATAAEDTESEPGASLIATAPGVQLVTTDLTGEAGEEPGDYQFNFGGTSGAAAQTTGVVALMKAARPDLGWRDYQEILLLSGVPFDNTFWANEAGTITPLGGLGFKFSYLWGGGRLNAGTNPFLPGAVPLAEIWARLPDSAAEYRVADQDLSASRKEVGLARDEDFDLFFGDQNNDGEIDRLLTVRTFLFDFNKTLSTEQNLRIEHVEVRIEWEEDEAGGNPRLLPVYAFLVDPYYINGPGNPNVDDIDLRPVPAPVTSPFTAHGSLLAGDVTEDGGVEITINTPRLWTYTTVRHWGLVNTDGEDRIGVPDWDNRIGESEEDVTPAGVWELDLAVAPRLINDDPDDPNSILFRELVDVEIIMYGTENNEPPSVIGADISSSGNPGVIAPRTAFADEDLFINNVELYDREGDPISLNYRWQMLGEDGLTWEDLVTTGFEATGCVFDQQVKIEVERDIGENTLGRYFLFYQPDGTSVACYFQPADTTLAPPAAVTNANQIVTITGILPNEGADGVAADIITALTAAGFTAELGLEVDEVLVKFPLRSGSLPAPDQGTSNYKVTLEVNPGDDPVPGLPRLDGNCFGGTTSGRLDSSLTIAGNVYRAILTPRQGLREGFLSITDQIIVNSRPITEAVAFTPYEYDADLWILTVPPEDLAPFLFINEMSQGFGGTTTNEEWVEIMVNFTTDLRGYKISNDVANFDVTFTDHPVWEEVEYGTIITVYNGGQKDPLIPADTPIEDFGTTKNWIISSDNPTLFVLPGNGDGWGELGNRDCTDPDSGCNGSNVSLLTNFEARSPVHGVSFNGNASFVDLGLVPAQSSAFFNGAVLEPGDPDSPTDPDAWVVDLYDPDNPTTTGAQFSTPASVNSAANQTVLDTIILEAKTSIPTYRFYPGDGSQVLLEPGTGNRTTDLDLVASDFVPGLKIDRKTGVISGIPNVPDGGVFTIKVQRWHSFSSEIQIYQLNIEAAPPLVDTDDEDNDGLINLLEEALVGNPFEAEANILPYVEVVDSAGMNYLALSFRRLKGGMFDATAQTYTVDDLVYSIEASTDLQTWVTGPAVVLIDEGAVDVVDNPFAEVATFRVMDAFGSAAIPQRYFLRLRITRSP